MMFLMMMIMMIMMMLMMIMMMVMMIMMMMMCWGVGESGQPRTLTSKAVLLRTLTSADCRPTEP